MAWQRKNHRRGSYCHQHQQKSKFPTLFHHWVPAPTYSRLYSSLQLLMASLLFLLFLLAAADADGASPAVGGTFFAPFYKRSVGINYGRVADNLPPPTRAVELIKSLGAAYVRIYDTDPTVLTALAGTGLQVSVTIPNNQIPNISADTNAARAWLQQNVYAYYPRTLITTIVAGNELLSPSADPALKSPLLQAMQNVHAALADSNLAEAVKVTTSLAMDVMGTSYPPSAGAFRSDLAMQPLLEFLKETDSFLVMDIYPFLAWSADSSNVSLSYALFDASDGSGGAVDGAVTYTNMLDAQIDAVIAAAEKLGYPDVKLVVGETGWPTAGAAGASVENAAKYNRKLVSRALGDPPPGTPRRPGTFIPFFIFALFNEDLKPGADTERNWGLFYPDGSAVYQIDLSGGDDDSGGSAPTKRFSEPEAEWCVVSSGAATDMQRLQAAMDFACGAGAECSAISEGQPCFEPNTLVAHAAYAFNSYWQRSKAAGATCDFDGAAGVTTSNPSHGGCVFEHS